MSFQALAKDLSLASTSSYSGNSSFTIPSLSDNGIAVLFIS
jgi:hypothetical protein